MAETTTPGKTRKMPAKKVAAKKGSTKKIAADIQAPEAKAPKTRAARTPKPVADDRVVVMHGEMRITHLAGADSETAVEAIGRLADEVNALGRVRIASAAHIGAVTTMHVVPPGHPQHYDLHPGIILEVTANNLVSFDHVAIGLLSPDLVNDAATALLAAIAADAENPAGPTGRRADWYEQAVLAAETVADRYASA